MHPVSLLTDAAFATMLAPSSSAWCQVACLSSSSTSGASPIHAPSPNAAGGLILRAVHTYTAIRLPLRTHRCSQTIGCNLQAGWQGLPRVHIPRGAALIVFLPSLERGYFGMVVNFCQTQTALEVVLSPVHIPTPFLHWWHAVNSGLLPADHCTLPNTGKRFASSTVHH